MSLPIAFEEHSNGANPVGWLQEFSLQNKQPVPDYTDRTAEKQVYGKFCFECRIGYKKVLGFGRTKKAAKFYSALRMLMNLDPHGRLQEYLKANRNAERNAAARQPLNQTSGANLRKSSGAFKYKSNADVTKNEHHCDLTVAVPMRGTQNPFASNVNDGSDQGHLQQLIALTNAHNFQCEFMSLPKRTASNEAQCLLKVQADDIKIVTHGSGEDMTRASCQAAQQAIESIEQYINSRTQDQ